MKISKYLKSAVFFLIMVFQVLYALLMVMSIQELKAVPPTWFRAAYIIVGVLPIIIAVIFLIKDYRNPPKYNSIKKAYVIPFICAFFDLLVLDAVTLLKETTPLLPVDFSRLPTLLLHSVLYFAAIGIILFLSILPIKLIKRRLPQYYTVAAIIIVYILLVLVSTGLMIVWIVIYGYFEPLGTTAMAKLTTAALYIFGGAIVYFYIDYLIEILSKKH